MYQIIALVLLVIASAAWTGWIAKRTGKSCRFWFWLSIPLPVIAICILLCLPESEEQKQRESREKQNNFFEDSKSFNTYETDISTTAY